MKHLRPLLLATLLCLLLTNCGLFKHAPKEVTETKDSTWTVERLIPKSYTVTIPAQTVLIHDSIPCPESELHKQVKKNNVTAKIDIHKGKIDVECLADSLMKVIDGMDKEIQTYRQRETTTTITQEPNCPHIATKPDIFCYIVTAASVAGILIWLYLKFKP